MHARVSSAMGSGLNTSTTDIQQNTISTNAMGKQMDVQPRNEMEMRCAP